MVLQVAKENPFQREDINVMFKKIFKVTQGMQIMFYSMQRPSTQLSSSNVALTVWGIKTVKSLYII